MIASRFTRLAGSLLFALVAVACGSDEKDSSRTVEPPTPTPAVLSFDAGPGVISAGGTSTLTWHTRDALSVAIVHGDSEPVPGVDPAAARGSVDVSPTETTTYTLTATGRDGLAAWATVTVTVASDPVGAPVIESFTATPGLVVAGGEVVLAWRTTGATLLSLKDDAGETIDVAGRPVAEGSVTVVPPRAPTTYFLVAVGPDGGRSSATVTVEVTGLPRVTRFFVDPLVPVHAGDSVTLVWETLHTTRVVIRQNGTTFVDTAEPSGRREVVLNDTADFELEASGPGGTARAEAMARVGARILAFSASDRVVRANDPVTLAWQLDDADGAVIDGPGGYHLPLSATELSGTAVVNVAAGGDFVLQAFRGDVAVGASLAIEVTAAPRIRTLTVDPTLVTAADDLPATVTLRWTQDGADRCTIFANNAVVPGYEGFDCAESGSAALPVAEDTTLRLVAINAGGTHAATVAVDAVAPPRIAAFTALPARRVAPGESVELRWRVTDAVGVSMTKNGAPLPIDATAFDGSVVDRVDFDAVYELTAVNSLGVPTRAEVRVQAGPPVIHAVEATPSFVAVGSAFTASWTADGGDRLTVTDAGGVVVFETTDPEVIDSGSAELLAPVIAGSYPYAVTTTNGAGSAQATFELTVSDGPMITSFTVDRAEISFGETVTFTWAVANDAYGNPPTLRLVDDLGHRYAGIETLNPNAGTLTITPAAERRYVFTLTASTGGGRLDSVATLAVEVTVPPILHSFTATPDLLSTQLGTVVPESVLAWRSENAVKVEIFDADAAGNVSPPPFLRVSRELGHSQAALDAGTVTVRPTATGYYVARAYNRVGTSVDRLVKVVVDPPQVLSFTAEPAEVAEGEPVVLAWDTHDATRVRLEPQPPAITRLGNTFVDVSTTGTKSTLSGDTSLATIPFPAGFVFPLAGTNYTQLQVSTNGWAGLTTTNSSNSSSPGAFPNSSRYVNFSLYTADLDSTRSTPNGELWYGTATDALGEFFVVQWKTWSWYSNDRNPSNLNFELVLRPNGNFEYRYGPMTVTGDATYAAGKGTSIGFQYPAANSFGTSLVPNGTAVAGGLAGTGWAFDVQLPLDGSITVTPAATTTYTLTALNADASEAKTATVTVWKRPAITAVAVNPSAPVATLPFTMTWTTTNANQVRVLDDTGAEVCREVDAAKVASGGCPLTSPTPGPKTFTVEASNGPLGSPVAQVSRTFTFTVFDLLAVTSLQLAPGEFAAPGETVTLSWTTAGAVEVLVEACTPRTIACRDITPSGTNVLAGSLTYRADASTEFRVHAYDVLYREDMKSTTVWVGVPSLDTLTASNPQVLPGGSTTLSWTSTDAASVSLSPPLPPALSEVTALAPYVDVSGSGTPVPMDGSDDSGRYAIAFPAGFTFPWFGTARTGLVATTDGWLTFNTAYSSSNYSNAALPASGNTDLAIAALWDDGEAVAPARVYWKLEAPANGPRYLVVQWKNFELYDDSASDLNFEIVLFENGDFDLRYGAMTGGSGYADEVRGSSATIGFQSPDRSVSHQIGYNTDISGGLASRSWRYRVSLPEDGSVTVSPTTSTTYRVCATNASLYEACREIRVVVIGPGDVLFSEAMIAPADDQAEWFEVRNLSPDALDLAGWVLSSGTETFPIPATPSLVVQPGGYLVFARSATAGGGLTPNVVYGNALTLTDSADSLTLLVSGSTIDHFAWDGTWTVPADRSIAANPTALARNAGSNDPAAVWCPTPATYGNGTYGGSPGAAGAGCAAP